MPRLPSSQAMFRLGLVMLLSGVAYALLGDPIAGWYYDTMLPGAGTVRALSTCLHLALFMGGLFLAAGSIAARHFEILKDELRNASGGGTNQ
ncbi:hypothetical protein [Paeniglutamicibacter psychrophenolicus]|uniref:hypothetical protein n=1 Tax=Paeniglutamicibacter psychrophenolicus TaxID=257454 RepID=UPI002787A2B1|nr:hypothetical protein [Paeniglutamicibacter psychrophenolicus]MDQ0092763.1 hypothetical protein [Paeniglutamicibacter psychrophenolicus]